MLIYTHIYKSFDPLHASAHDSSPPMLPPMNMWGFSEIEGKKILGEAFR